MTNSCSNGAQLLEAVEALYDAGFDRQRWPEALRAIGALLGAPVVLLSEVSSGGWRIANGIGLTAAQTDRYERWHSLDPLGGAPPVDRLDPAVRVVHRAAHAESSFFTHFADAIGLDSGLSIGSRDRDGLGLILWRTTGAPFGDGDGDDAGNDGARLLRRLWPHVARAWSLRTRTWEPAARGPASWAETLIERWPVGIVSLGSGGSIRHANQLARAFAAARDGFGLAFDGPVAATASETRALRQSIRMVMDRAAPHDEWLQLSRPSGRRPYEVMLRRTPSSEPAQAGVAMLLADPEHRPDLCTRALRTLYKLTPAEARIARRLVHGAAVEAIAGELRLSLKTTRWYVGQLREKLGACSQTEIVRLILSGPLPAGQHVFDCAPEPRHIDTRSPGDAVKVAAEQSLV